MKKNSKYADNLIDVINACSEIGWLLSFVYIIHIWSGGMPVLLAPKWRHFGPANLPPEWHHVMFTFKNNYPISLQTLGVTHFS
jgi:hypothetical protein